VVLGKGGGARVRYISLISGGVFPRAGEGVVIIAFKFKFILLLPQEVTSFLEKKKK
jgi:hypothetical protein